MKRFNVGEMVLAYPFDEYLGYYRGDDNGEAIPVEIIRQIPNTPAYAVFLPNGYPHVYHVKELFRTQEEIEALE